MTLTAIGTGRGGIWKDSSFPVVSGTTTETNLITSLVAGGSLNLNNKATFSLSAALSTATLVPGTLTFRIKYGSAVITVGSAPLTLIGAASNAPVKIVGFITNRDVTNAQYMQAQLTIPSGGISLSQPIAISQALSAIDSTVDQAFAITAQFSNGSASNSLTTYYIEFNLNS